MGQRCLPTEQGGRSNNRPTTRTPVLEKGTPVKLTKTLAAALSGLAISTAALATPVAAAPGDDPTPTVATISLTGGALSVDGPATATGSASVAPGTTMTVNVGSTSVVDNRGSLLGWTVTGASTNFVHSSDSAYSMSKALFTWATGTVATTNGSLLGVAAGAGGSMGATFAVATATPLKGSGTFTYPATVTGVVPANLIAGDYVGTITQSVV